MKPLEEVWQLSKQLEDEWGFMKPLEEVWQLSKLLEDNCNSLERASI